MADYLKRFSEPFVIESEEALDTFIEAFEKSKKHNPDKKKIKKTMKEIDDGERFVKAIFEPFNIYLISDTHFGHFNIIEYENRPFLNTKEMDEYIIKSWNKTVNHKDIVLHLGDFFLTNTKRQLEIMEQLNGRIILIKGNHDGQSKTKLVERLGFKAVYQSLTFMVDDYTLILTHMPLELTIEDEFYFREHKIINVHGHVHGIKEQKSRFHYCVSAENVLYKPISIERLIKLIQRDEKIREEK